MYHQLKIRKNFKGLKLKVQHFIMLLCMLKILVTKNNWEVKVSARVIQAYTVKLCTLFIVVKVDGYWDTGTLLLSTVL